MDGTPLHHNLTDRQEQILRMVARGHTNTEIAAELGISLNGVKWHIREMFAKYGVDTREELSEAWQESRRPVNRMRGWVRGLTFGVPLGLKVTAGGTVAAVVLGVAAGSVVAVVNMDQTPAAEAGKKEAKATATPWPTPVATPTIEIPRGLLAPAGTRVILDEESFGEDAYLTVLYQMPEPLSLSGLGQMSTRGVYTLRDLEVERVEYIPDLPGEYELGDGDHYLPAPEGGAARDLYKVTWRIPDVPVLIRPGVADFLLTAVYEAGHPDKAWWHYEFGDRSGSTFTSRREESAQVESRYRLHVQPSGDPIFLAYRDNLQGTQEWMAAYPTLSGDWCAAPYVANTRSGAMCPFVRTEPIWLSGNSTHYDNHGSVLDRSLVVLTAPEITSIQVVSDSFEPRTYATQPIPDDLPFDGCVAYITLLPSPSSFVVIGYNETGEEVARASPWP